MDFEGLGQRVLERLEHHAAVALGFHVFNATERAVYFGYRARQMVGNGSPRLRWIVAVRGDGNRASADGR